MRGTNEPNIIGNELKYISKSIKNNEIAVGRNLFFFEKKLKKNLKAKHLVLCSSGTAALQVALKAIGLKKNDEVIVPSFTFIATINSVIYNNCQPIFMDCDEHCNINVDKVLEFLKNNTFKKGNYTFNKKTKKRIYAIVPVHVWGGLVNIEKLKKICRLKNIKIVEDATESVGAKYTKGYLKNKFAGTVGDMGCLSFNGNKIITSGGGGAIIASSKKLAIKAKYLINQATDDGFSYTHKEVGFNYRMSNIHASIGLAQLEKINFFVQRKKIIHEFYKKKFLKYKNVKILSFPKYSKNNFWQTTLLIKSKSHIKKIQLIKSNLEKKGFLIRKAWLPCHLQKPYKHFEKYKITNSENISSKLICLPCGTSLKSKDLNVISKVILNCIDE